MQHPLFEGICRQLIGEQISVFRAMFMNKPAHQGTVLPYHQDGGTQWGLDRERFITIWTALDDATVENGCVEIVPGTHRLGCHEHATPSPEQEAEHCDPRRACPGGPSRRDHPAPQYLSTAPASTPSSARGAPSASSTWTAPPGAPRTAPPSQWSSAKGPWPWGDHAKKRCQEPFSQRLPRAPEKVPDTFFVGRPVRGRPRRAVRRPAPHLAVPKFESAEDLVQFVVDQHLVTPLDADQQAAVVDWARAALRERDGAEAAYRGVLNLVLSTPHYQAC